MRLSAFHNDAKNNSLTFPFKYIYQSESFISFFYLCMAGVTLTSAGIMSPCMTISSPKKIDDATIAIDETTTLEIKATIWPRRYFQKSSFDIKILFGKSSRDNWKLVFIEDEFSVVI